MEKPKAQEDRTPFLDLICIIRYDLDSKQFVLKDVYPPSAEPGYLSTLPSVCFPEPLAPEPFAPPSRHLCNYKRVLHYSLTTEDGSHAYASFLHFYEVQLDKKLLLPTAICFVSPHPFFIYHRECFSLIHQKVVLNKLTKTFDFFFVSRQLPSYSEEDSLEFYISLMASHLWHSSAYESEIVLERRFLKQEESNALDSSLVKTQEDDEIRLPLLTYVNSRLYGLSLDVFPARIALEQIKSNSIVTLVNVLLLEKKLILIKEDVGDLAIIIEGLLSFIRPFQWHFTCISYLTRDLIDSVESPFPYIMGISRELWSTAFAANIDEISYDQFFLEEVVIFDVDRNIIKMKEDLFEHIPYNQEQYLIKNLRLILNKHSLNAGVSESMQSIPQHLTEKPTAGRVAEEKAAAAGEKKQWLEASLRTKKVFLNFFLMMINNFFAFYKDDVKVESHSRSTDLFKFKEYLSFFKKDELAFMKKFTSTQAFHYFVEKCAAPDCRSDPHIKFFRKNVKLLCEASYKEVTKEQRKLMEGSFKKACNPIKYSWDHCLKEYQRAIIEKHGDRTFNVVQALL